MTKDNIISLTETEAELRDCLLGAANLYAKDHDGRKPILRFAGGWVRDKLFGENSMDIDVALDCTTGEKFYAYCTEFEKTQKRDTPETEWKKLRKGGLVEKNPDQSKHLETVATKWIGLEIDLVNLRTETYNEDSRNPQMQMGTPAEDALRRDATINALFYNLDTKEVEDFTGRGLQDLEDRKIRTPLDPEQTFRDDPLRILRLIRFACRFDFDIEKNALYWMKDESIQDTLERKISRERILVELTKMLKGPRPRQALETILDRGLYNTIFTVPGLPKGVVPRVAIDKIPRPLRELDDLIHGSGQSNPIYRVLLNDHTKHWRAYLLCALIPWYGQQAIGALAENKGSLSMAGRVARDGLKLDGKSLDVIEAAERLFPELRDQCKALGTQIESADSPTKRKRRVDDRVTVGMAIRKWGKTWGEAALAALLREVAEVGDVDGKALRQAYEAWLSFIAAEKLSDTYDLKTFPPILNGKEILDGVAKVKGDVPKGPWMTDAVSVVFRYQLREGKDSSKDGAVKAVVEAIEDRIIDLQAKAAKKQ